jgi:hypothetical protein
MADYPAANDSVQPGEVAAAFGKRTPWHAPLVIESALGLEDTALAFGIGSDGGVGKTEHS